MLLPVIRQPKEKFVYKIISEPRFVFCYLAARDWLQKIQMSWGSFYFVSLKGVIFVFISYPCVDLTLITLDGKQSSHNSTKIEQKSILVLSVNHQRHSMQRDKNRSWSTLPFIITFFKWAMICAATQKLALHYLENKQPHCIRVNTMHF